MSAREARTYAVFGFTTTHAALDAERLLTDLGVRVTPIPAPAVLGGALCGIALRLELSDVERAETLLERAGIAPAARGETRDM